MELGYGEEQRFLREAVRGVVEREASLAQVRTWVLEGDEVQLAPAQELAARQGWTGIGIPEEAGGQGGGAIELAILAEELGRGAVPADGLYASLLCARALHALGGADEVVERLAAGETTGTVLRPGDRPLDTPAGNPSAPRALVLGAPLAEVLLDLDGTAPILHRRESVTVRPRAMLDRTRALGDVDSSAAGSSATRLGAGAEWAALAVDLSGHAAVLVAADALGAAQRMLEETVAYVSERVQFGVPVGSFQAVKHAAAQMLVSIEGTLAAVQYAAWAVAAGETGAPTDAWVAKAQAARAACAVADTALFLHGAVGYTWEHDLQLLIKRAKSDAQLFGGPGTYLDRVADALALA